jgi:hypothetical protein
MGAPREFKSFGLDAGQAIRRSVIRVVVLASFARCGWRSTSTRNRVSEERRDLPGPSTCAPGPSEHMRFIPPSTGALYPVRPTALAILSVEHTCASPVEPLPPRTRRTLLNPALRKHHATRCVNAFRGRRTLRSERSPSQTTGTDADRKRSLGERACTMLNGARRMRSHGMLVPNEP